MSYQSELIFLTLKDLLKERRMTYADIAVRLGSSEASIKNMFYKRKIDLSRLGEICEVLGLTLFNFMALAGQYKDDDFYFSEIQEEYLIENPGHLAFFFALLERKSIAQIEQIHKLSKTSSYRYVRDLEKLNLIEQRSESQIVLIKKGRLVWRKNGPWMKKFYADLTSKQAEIMARRSSDKDYLANFGLFSLKRDDLDAFYRDIDSLFMRYKDLAYQQFIGLSDGEQRFSMTWNLMVLPDIIEVNPPAIPNLDES